MSEGLTQLQGFWWGVALACAVLAPAFWTILKNYKHVKDEYRQELERADRYQSACEDVVRWCSGASREAALIARHVEAHGEGRVINSGTPCADEPCTINGLREQLKRINQLRYLTRNLQGKNYESHH